MSDTKRLGVTYQIRSKLNFLDERQWKRFSARRLELIDTMDLSSKKASEQEDDIKNVAETLRTEFNYSQEYYNDFDRLVRAAIQSVRRNRKRSYRTKKSAKGSEPLENHSQDDYDHHDTLEQEHPKRQKLEPANHDSLSPTLELVTSTNKMSLLAHNGGSTSSVDSGAVSPVESHLGLRQRNPGLQNDESEVSDYLKYKFISEISRLNSDSQDDFNDRNYPRTRAITAFDNSRVAIDSITQPRIGANKPAKEVPRLPPISGPNSRPLDFLKANATSTTSTSVNTTAVSTSSSSSVLLLNFIERSKSCSKSKTSLNTDNLELFGKNIISCCMSFLFEKSLYSLNPTSIEYLRNKLQLHSSLARIFRELDPSVVSNVTDESAVISLYTLLGGCVKDFGFDAILFPFTEILYSYVVKDYPLISKNAIPFKRGMAPASSLSTTSLAAPVMMSSNAELNPPMVPLSAPDDDLHQLNSLAAIASDIQSQEQSLKDPAASEPNKKVTLKFLTSVLEFTYPATNSAVPRLIELIENGKLAFKLPLHNDSLIFSLKNVKDGSTIESDADLEKIFQQPELCIDLEMYVRRAKDIPINQLTSTVLPSEGPYPPKILFPPTYGSSRPPAYNTMLGIPPLGPHGTTTGFRFLSNLEDTPPPPPNFPKFQPLL